LRGPGPAAKVYNMTVRNSPTVRRRRLGLELRRLRELAGKTCEQAGDHLDCSASKISRIETARVPARTVDVQALCQLYGSSEEQAAILVTLARESKQEGWWQTFDDAFPDWFGTYLGLEAEAASIRTYEIQLVPGLLQTEGYARALYEVDEGDSPEEIEVAWTTRLTRQEILSGSNPPRYWVVLSEAALRRVIGGRAVMRDQLLHLADVTDLPNITIQVIANEQGAHPAMYAPFVILDFPERADPGVVYLEHLAGALYIDKPDQVDRYSVAFNYLVATALPPKQSMDLIRTVAKELS
jgi:transcriptional regulator with XRE-family HTH domain